MTKKKIRTVLLSVLPNLTISLYTDESKQMEMDIPTINNLITSYVKEFNFEGIEILNSKHS